MNPIVANALNLPFVQITLPILIGLLTLNWNTNKRLDSISARLNQRLDSIDRRADSIDTRLDLIEHRLERIDVQLDEHSASIARLQERLTLVRF